MKKQLKDTQILLEILILTAAVAIIAAAVYFFWYQAILLSAVFRVLVSYFPTLYRCPFRHHHDSERSTSDHRLFYLRKRIWCKTVYTSIMLPVFLGLLKKSSRILVR